MAGSFVEATSGAVSGGSFATPGIVAGDALLGAVLLNPSTAAIVGSVPAAEIAIVATGFCCTTELDTSAYRIIVNFMPAGTGDLPEQPWASLPDPLTPDTLRAFLAKGDTPSTDGTLSDEELQRFINTAAARIETECDRWIVARAATIEFPVKVERHQCEVRCYKERALPIQSISAVQLVTADGTVIDVSERGDPPTRGWHRRSDLDRRGILLCDTPSQLHEGCTWRVTGVFGFDPTVNVRELSDLAEAIKLWAADTWASRIPSSDSLHVEGMTMSFTPGRINLRIVGILEKYRQLGA